MTILYHCSDDIRTIGPPCYDGEVRLVDGRYPHEGRVEVCLNETWGKICDHISIYGWDRTEAEVVCKQLGYNGASEGKCTLVIILYP